MSKPSVLERYSQLSEEQLESATSHAPADEDRLDEMDVLWEEMSEDDRTEARHYVSGLLANGMP